MRPRIWFILFSNTSPQVKALWAWNLHRSTSPCASFLSNWMEMVRFELVTAGSTRLWYHVKESSHLKIQVYRWDLIIWFILLFWGKKKGLKGTAGLIGSLIKPFMIPNDQWGKATKKIILIKLPTELITTKGMQQ